MFESWARKMVAGCLFFVLLPEKDPLSPCFCFLSLSRICSGFIPKSGFSSKRSPFSLPPGRGCCKMSKNGPLLQPREWCNAPKTRHHSQIDNALSFRRLFQVTLVSPLMSLDHYGSENVIISPAWASSTTWTPISCRSLPDGRDFSSDDLISLHTLGIYWNTYVF